VLEDEGEATETITERTLKRKELSKQATFFYANLFLHRLYCSVRLPDVACMGWAHNKKFTWKRL
jgi:hypothetical protein